MGMGGSSFNSFGSCTRETMVWCIGVSIVKVKGKNKQIVKEWKY